MTIYRACLLDTPEDPFTGAALRTESDGALQVIDGKITDRGAYTQVRSRCPDDDVIHLDGGLLLPGFIDTHVHFPQVRVIGGLGMPLLEWLDRCALPEEARLAQPSYARGVAADFVRGLAQAGTTSALVFGSHFASAVDLLFEEAAAVGLRITSGVVLSDRILREDLLTDAQRGLADSLALAARWSGQERLRYAVTPRFSLSCTDDLLAACGELMRQVDGALFTSHINENVHEIARVRELFGTDYLGSYLRHGLVGNRSIFAHNVHPADSELAAMAEHDAAVAHCPTSNAALGSGLFPLRRHLDAGVRVALGSDVGAGTGFNLLKEGLQAYFMQSLLGADGMPMTPAQLLSLMTRAGADALALPEVGDLSVGRRFDAVWVRPVADTVLDVALRHAEDESEALARTFALGASADLASVWVDGEVVHQR